MNLPDDFDYERFRIGFEWSDPSRYQRIEEVLNANDSMTLADSMALQNDDTSMLGRRLVQLVTDLEPATGADSSTVAALDLLQGWDGAVTVDSAAGVVSELMLRSHLGKATVQRASPAEAMELIGNGSITSVMALLENPDERLGADPEAARTEILQEALTNAVAEAVTLLGGDPAHWQWGALHKGYFKSAMVPLLHERMVDQFNVGPFAMGGASTTPRAASYNSNFEVTSGASFRMVLDVGNWDASRAINAPGQSGDPMSAHYRDLAPLWAAGEYVPLSYSREAVESNASFVLELTPDQ